MVSFAQESGSALIPAGTNRFRVLVASCRSAVRSMVAALRPRVGSRRAGSRRSMTRPVRRDRFVNQGRPAPHGRPVGEGRPVVAARVAGDDRPAGGPIGSPRLIGDPGLVALTPDLRPAAPPDGWPDTGETAMTIVMVRASDVRRGTAKVVARLAELAVNDELLVVCGSNETRSGPIADVVTSGLRRLLPRHDVVAMHVEPHASASRRGAAMVGEFLEVGSLPILVTPVTAVRDLVAELSSYLRADRVLGLSCTTGGADLRQVWTRQPVVSAPVVGCALN